MNFRVAITEKLLVDDRQQRILYGRPRLPYFIKEHYIGCRQITLRVTFIFVRVLQFADAHWAEYLVRCAET